MPVQGKEEAANKLNALMSSEVTRFVDWTDKDDEKHHDKIIVEDPGIEYATQAIDKMDVGNDLADYAGLFGIAMDHVIDSPSLSYDQLEKDLPDADKSTNSKTRTPTGKWSLSAWFGLDIGRPSNWSPNKRRRLAGFG